MSCITRSGTTAFRSSRRVSGRRPLSRRSGAHDGRVPALARLARSIPEGARLDPLVVAVLPALPRIVRPRRWSLGLYVASALAVTLQQGVLHQSNNFRVFRSAAINLLARRDLYAAHPEQHFDFYKYSPTFALLFAPLAYLPFALAFLCWTLLNALLQYLYMALGTEWPNWPVQLAGTALLLAPLALGRARWRDAAFRRLFLCSVLVYVVLFNHQAERATFVIAYTGIVVWYVSSGSSRLKTAILALTLLVMVVADVDIVPRWVKAEILIPYRIKGIPCVVAWFAMQAELFATALRSESGETALPGTAPELPGA